MISYNTVLSSMDALVQGAKLAGDEQQLRESLAAIRALCNVVLQNGEQPTNNTRQVQQQTQSTIQNSPDSLSSNKMQEQDANGDSIFDF
ncbi:YwdI family protein [Lysinibacillus sp. 54212]|uniref:YwdI family protein n=1 Tax=Lysinibacillus sp. 54212 TaxID=3119829 RepID=UPI002FC914F0